MIDALQVVLRRLFETKCKAPLERGADRDGPFLKVLFEPPDSDFPKADAAGPILNVYLLEVRENRKIRKSEKITVGTGNDKRSEWTPSKIDCHFLATPYVKSQDSEFSVLDQNQLLYEASAVILRNSPLDVREILGVPEDFPEASEITDAHIDFLSNQNKLDDQAKKALREGKQILSRSLGSLLVEPLPPEGFSKISEFWGLMGANARWRPSFYFIVTLPVRRLNDPSGPPVRSISTNFVNRSAKTIIDVNGNSQNTGNEKIVSIGGTIRRSGEPAPGLPVILDSKASHMTEASNPPKDPQRHVQYSTRTDPFGSFRFALLPNDLQPGFQNWEWTLLAANKSLTLPIPLVSSSPIDIDISES